MLLVCATLTLTSCKDGKGVGSFNANINGEEWTAMAPTGAKTGNRITVTGISLNKQIVINIAGTTTGTYNMNLINGSINPLVYTPDVNMQGAQQTFAGTSGSIIVTDINDTRLSGTFNVSASNSNMTIININGSFTDVRYF